MAQLSLYKSGRSWLKLSGIDHPMGWSISQSLNKIGQKLWIFRSWHISWQVSIGVYGSVQFFGKNSVKVQFLLKKVLNN